MIKDMTEDQITLQIIKALKEEEKEGISSNFKRTPTL